MAIQDVIVVSVPVSDQARAKGFYVETLGFELVSEDDSVPGFHWVRVAPKGGSTSLTLVTWFESMPPGSLRGLVLTSSDLKADYGDLVAKGVKFDGPPEPQPYAALETVLRDLTGTVSFCSRPSTGLNRERAGRRGGRPRLRQVVDGLRPMAASAGVLKEVRG